MDLQCSLISERFIHFTVDSSRFKVDEVSNPKIQVKFRHANQFYLLRIINLETLDGPVTLEIHRFDIIMHSLFTRNEK